MGLRIVVPDVQFSNYIDISDYPVATDLSALFYLGTDANTSKVNHAPDFPDANTPGANVTYSPGYATFSGAVTTAANYIETAEYDSASTDFTRIAIFQKMDTTERSIWGHFNGVTSGSGFLSTSSFIVTGAALVSRALYGSTASPSFRFAAQKYTGGVLTTYLATGGVLAAGVTNAGTRAPLSSVPERIGGSATSSSYTGVARIAMVSKHRSALTDDQIADIYAFCKSLMARKGLTLG